MSKRRPSNDSRRRQLSPASLPGGSSPNANTFPANILRMPSFYGVLAIVALVLLTYAPSFRGGFILDDDVLVTANPLVHAPDGLYRLWCTTENCDYWPITYTSLWIEWRLWGNNPLGYHLVNVALHIISCLLIWVVARKLAIPGAFWGALLFAIHPVNVESVAWIAQRKNLLAFVFFLASDLRFPALGILDRSRTI